MAPQRPIGYWLALVDRLINEQFEATLDEHGVTRLQWQMLSLVGDAPVTPVELEHALAPFVAGLEPSAVTDQLEELLDSAWVERQDEVLALSERGRTSFGRLGEVVERAGEQVAEGVSSEEYAQTLVVLERMARNAGWTEPASDAPAPDAPAPDAPAPPA